MHPSITPETAKKIKRLMWVHVLLTVLSLAVLGYMSWLVWNAEPARLIYFAALLFVLRELLRGYWKLYDHWVELQAGAAASGFRRWWR